MTAPGNHAIVDEELEPSDAAIPSSPVVHEPALHGLLVNVHDLGLTVIRVDHVENDNSPGDSTV